MDDERDDVKETVEKGAKKVKTEFDKKSNNPKAEFGKGVVESVVETGDAVAHPRRTGEGIANASESFAKDPVGSTKKTSSAVGRCFETNAGRCAGKTAAAVVGTKGAGAAAKGAGAAAKRAKGADAASKGAKGADAPKPKTSLRNKARKGCATTGVICTLAGAADGHGKGDPVPLPKGESQGRRRDAKG